MLLPKAKGESAQQGRQAIATDRCNRRRRDGDGSGLRLRARACSAELATRAPRLLGDFLRQRRFAIAAVQWVFVVLYLVLLIVPAGGAGDAPDTDMLRKLGKFAEVIFWGVWWPGVILSVMLFGQFWCGLFCPDGTLTEFISRHGKGRKIPVWLRLPALPLSIFAIITLFEYALEARYTPRGTLLAVGSTTVLAVVCGIFYGRGKRVWCRYACPMGGLFSLLARCAILHFRVDREVWDSAPRPVPKPVECPVLLNVRHLSGSDKCNMCGRCSGHRNAVELAWRPPGEEIATLCEGEARSWEAAGIVFVLIGLFYGALHWRHSSWHHALLVLEIPPTLAAFAAILLPAVVLGSSTALLLAVVAGGKHLVATRLAYALIPLGGFGLFVGAMEHSLLILHDEGMDVAPLMPWLRVSVMLPAIAWSAHAGWGGIDRGVAARTCYVFGIALLGAAWVFAPNPFVAYEVGWK